MQATPSRSRPTSRIGSSSGAALADHEDAAGVATTSTGAGAENGATAATSTTGTATTSAAAPNVNANVNVNVNVNVKSNITSTTTGPNTSRTSDLWTDILRSADRQKALLARKNVVLLSERHRGRALLLDKLVGKRRTAAKQDREAAALAIGYEVLEGGERDEDAAPPVSVFYPPSSHPMLLQLVDVSLPPHPLPDTAVVIVLDWTKPSTMVRELLNWLAWVNAWAARADEKHGDGPELRERLQSHLQHYTEPAAATAPNLASYSNLGTVLPLGPGTLTLNPHGVPIVVVCTRADLMDHVGDEMGMKGGGWEERTDWIQQVIRTVCLSYGAALFYTAPTQPQTYTLLRDYLYHRLYTVPPSLHAAPTDAVTANAPVPPSRFPFPHRANVLDRDAVLVPAGWDSWGKINVLRDGFDPARVGRAWENSASRLAGNHDNDDEGIEDLWVAMVPDTERPKLPNPSALTTTSEPEQAFLQRQLDTLLKDPNRDARAAFRHAANSASAAGVGVGGSGSTPTSASGAGKDSPSDLQERYAGVVGPMGSGGLSLPGVEKAMAEMEGEDVKDRFARISRRDSKPTSPTQADRSTVGNEALHNFFQGLLAKKSGQASVAPTPTKATK